MIPILNPTPATHLRSLALAALVATAPGLAQETQVTTEPCQFQVQLVAEQGHLSGAKLVDSDGRTRAFDNDHRMCLDEADLESWTGADRPPLVVADGFVVRRLPRFAPAPTDSRPAGPRELVVRLAPAFGEQVVVSAHRAEQRLLDVPMHIQRLDRNTIQASSARTLADAIEYAAGVRVESNCQNCNFSQVRMLGLEGPYTQILEDGQPSLSSLAMVYGIEQIPASTLESIEITKGGGSAIYGGGAVGGTINLIPRASAHRGGHLELEGLETGGAAGRSALASVEWATDDQRQQLLGLLQDDDLDPADLDGDGYTEVASRALRNVKVRHQGLFRSDRAQFVADLNWTDSSRRGGDLERFDRPPEETDLTEAIDTERSAVTLRWIQQISPALDLRAAASGSRTDRASYYGADFDPNAYGTSEGAVELLDLQMNRYTDLATWSFGTQFLRDDLLDLQPGHGRRLDETYDTTSLFGQQERRLGAHTTVLLGLRVDDHSALDEPIWSPRLSVLANPHRALTLRASVASGFRPPATFDEDLHIELVGGGRPTIVHNDPDLEAERSLASVLSAEWKPTFGRRGSAAFELVLFRTDLDELFFVRDANDPATPVFERRKTNFGGATVQGVELAAAYRFGASFFVEASLVEQTARFDEADPDFGSLDFYRTPQSYGSLNLQVTLPGDLDLFGGLLYTGSMEVPHYAGFIAEDRLETTGDFLTASVGLSRDFSWRGRTIEVALAAKNVTDEYQPDLDRGPARDSAYVYGPRLPRTFSLSVGFEW